MKTTDKIMIFGLIASILLVNISNIPMLSAELVNITGMATAGSQASEQDNMTCEAVQNMTKPYVAEPASIPFEYYPESMLSASYSSTTTINGMTIESGSLTNTGNSSVTASVNAFGRSLSASIAPSQTWTFVSLRGRLITSDSSDLRIDPSRTVYYEMNNWLTIAFEGNCKDSTIMIYTDAVPTRLSSSVNANWKYDYDSKLLMITLKSCSEHELTVDWNLYPTDRKVIYVEDFTDYEPIVYSIDAVHDMLDNVTRSVGTLNASLSLLEKDSKSILGQINQTVEEKNTIAFDIESKQQDIKSMNQTAADIQKKIMENTILTPLQSLLVATIMLALLLYIALFGLESFTGKKKVEINETK